MILFRKKSLAITLLALAVFLLVFGVFTLSRPKNTNRNFTLSMLSPTPPPKAIFEKQTYHSRWVRPAGTSFETRVWVFRHKKWIQLEQSEVQQMVGFETLIHFAPNRATHGYTVTVQVPVCERWKIETVIGQTRRIGWKALALDFTSTNCWTSDEIPGWSEIRQRFHATTP